jgi:hypothetical protein
MVSFVYKDLQQVTQLQEFKYHISCNAKQKKKKKKTQYIDFLTKQIKHTTQKQSGFKIQKIKI